MSILCAKIASPRFAGVPFGSPQRVLAWMTRSLALAVLAWVPSARALNIFQLDPVKNCRFSSGTVAEGNLKVNPNFLLADYDLSGLGWGPDTLNITLISPQHFLSACHVTPGAGMIVSFRNREGVIKHYTVESVYYVEHTPGVRTDLSLCRLTAPIPPEDHIGYFPTLRLPADRGYTGIKVFSFGHGQVCGNTTIARWGVFDLLPFNAHDHVADDTMFVMEWHGARHDEAQAGGSDSGSPTFTVYKGRLAVIGIHSAVSITEVPFLTVDVLVPAYFSTLNTHLAADGFALENAFTEPALGKPAHAR